MAIFVKASVLNIAEIQRRLQGRFQLYMNQPVVGSSCNGGYAELMRARSTGLVAIPQELRSEEAAPILCAGIATFNALNKSGAQAGTRSLYLASVAWDIWP